MYVSTLVGVSVCFDQVYKACPIIFMGYKPLLDVVIFDMEEFDIILGMSLLSL